MTTRLYVGNLSWDTQEDDLIKAFEQDGRTVTSARIMTDRHWATDVLLGAGIGLGFGWLLPELVYYTSVPLGDGRGRATLTPFALEGGAGLAGVGQF